MHITLRTLLLEAPERIDERLHGRPFGPLIGRPRAGVLFYLVYAPLVVVGLIFFKALVFTAACALLLDTARTLGGRLPSRT